jgi:hypothetical protein
VIRAARIKDWDEGLQVNWQMTLEQAVARLEEDDSPT